MNFKESKGGGVRGRILREERNDIIIIFKKNKKVHVFTNQRHVSLALQFFSI